MEDDPQTLDLRGGEKLVFFNIFYIQSLKLNTTESKVLGCDQMHHHNVELYSCFGVRVDCCYSGQECFWTDG